MVLIIASSLFFFACQKKTEQPITTQIENISRKELSLWIGNYLKMIPDGPKPLIDKATKTYYKGQMIVKIPLSSGGGQFYFTKTDRLEVQFIRVVSAEDQMNNPFSGYYEFIDMNTFAYQVINFKAGKETNRVKHSFSQPNIAHGVIKRNSGEGGYYEGSWFGAFIHCITNYLIAIPKREGSGWRCYGPGSVENVTPGDAGASIFDWPTWFLTNPPIDYNLPNAPDYWVPYTDNAGYYDPSNPNYYTPPSNNINPIIEQHIQELYNSINKSDDDIETGDLDNNQQGNEDSDLYSEFNIQTQIWPTISNVISPSEFVGWNRSLHPNWECMDYAKAQIAKKGKLISDYFSANQTIQTYTSSNGVNLKAVKEGITYLIASLQSGNPVIVGIDDQAGSPNRPTDNTTDHFIVVVGMGTDSNGLNFFTFYDNASGLVSQGASSQNRLYYNINNGMITGKSQTDYAKVSHRYDYIVTQIRKNKK